MHNTHYLHSLHFKSSSTGFKTYDVNDFVSRLRTQYQNENGVFDWAALGKKVSPKFNSTPSANFMYERGGKKREI